MWSTLKNCSVILVLSSWSSIAAPAWQYIQDANPTSYSSEPDLILNQALTRTKVPQSILRLNVEDYNKLPILQTTRPRDRWWESDRHSVQKWEEVGIQVQGYPQKLSKHETPPWLQSGNAWHITLLASLTQQQSGFKVLVNNTFLTQHKLHPRLLSRLGENTSLTQVIGWLVWDNLYTQQWYLVATQINFRKYGAWYEMNGDNAHLLE